MNKKYIYIWKICGLPIYVGQGSHNKETKYRRATEIHIFSDGKLAYCELKRRKHIDDFTVEIIFDNLTEDEANEIEIYLISKYGKKINNTGILYNILDGGHTNPLLDENVRIKRLNTFQSDKHRELQSKLGKERWCDQSYRNKMIEIRKNINIDNSKQCKKIEYDGITYKSKGELARTFGITLKVLNYRLGHGIDLATKKKLKVEIEYEGVKYETAQDLAKAFGKSPSLISKNIKKGLDPIRGNNV